MVWKITYHIRWPPLNVTIFIAFTCMCNCLMGALQCSLIHYLKNFRKFILKKKKKKIPKQFNSIDAMRWYYVSARSHTVQVQSFFETLLCVLFMVLKCACG